MNGLRNVGTRARYPFSLRRAVTENEYQKAIGLLKTGADPNAQDNEGNTLLHIAVDYYDVEIEMVKLLIQHGADINAQNNYGHTPLHTAAGERDSPETVKLLIQHGADINAQNDEGNTPLHYAAAENAPETVKLLIQHGADINTQDRGGITPLHIAAWADMTETVKLLIQHGADSRAKEDENGNTPLHTAAEENAPETVKLLIQHGADSNAQNNEGNTPLHYAAGRRDSPETVKLLIQHGADANAQNNYGHTPLYTAAERRNTNAEIETVKLLIQHGADSRAKEDENGNTPLHSVAGTDTTDAIETVKLLIQRGADANAQNNYGRTPLHNAAAGNATETVKLLIQHGADSRAKDKNGRTLLHYAATGNATETVKLLIQHGADSRAKDKNGRTPLHCAAAGNATETVKLLIQHGVDVNTQDKVGITPLHIAAEKQEQSEFRIAALLLEHGADVKSKNIAGMTPLDLAVLAHDTETASVFLDAAEVINKKENPRNLSKIIWEISKQEGCPKTSQGTVRMAMAEALEESKVPKILLNLLFYLGDNSDLLKETTYIQGITALANHHESWLRVPEEWHPTARHRDRQFSELARHLLAIYDVPDFMDSVWFKGNETHQNWFKHIGAGQNIRNASDLPIPLTKKMAHYFLTAPNDYTLEEAFRWGQVHALGGDSRLANALRGTKLTQSAQDLWTFTDLLTLRDFWGDNNDFWVSVIHFFIANPMLDVRHVGPIIDYIWKLKYAEPDPLWYMLDRLEFHQNIEYRKIYFDPHFTMKGRTQEALLRRVAEWHETLGYSSEDEYLDWPPSQIGEFYFLQEATEKQDMKLWSIRELLNSTELIEEGKMMSHCIATHAFSCSARSSSIWTMEAEDNYRQQKVLTIEVSLSQKCIREVRGKGNRLPTLEEKSILKKWADTEGLQLATYI